MAMDFKQYTGPCSCGKSHAISAHDAILKENALEQLPRLLSQPFYRDFVHWAVICDEHTYEAAGRRVCALLPVAGSVVLPPENLHADEHGVALLLERLPVPCDAMLAVGSGTVHDLTRYVAKEKGVPFISVPTAASVDGFVSSVAAMTWGGYKITFPSVPPVAVVADSSVIAKAPARLTRSGMGDLLGKYIALADWKIAHLVTGEYFCERICRMEEQAVQAVVQLAGASLTQDVRICEKLMEGLLLSGFAMQMVGNSRPASGAEHHCSHFWEMEVMSPYIDALHGEKVGVGTLLAARAYHHAETQLRRGTFEILHHAQPELHLLEQYAGPEQMQAFRKENTPDPLADISAEDIRRQVGGIADLLRAIPSEEKLHDLLRGLGACCSLEEIGLREEMRTPTLQFSPYVRRRLTFMRLLKRFRFSP